MGVGFRWLCDAEWQSKLVVRLKFDSVQHSTIVPQLSQSERKLYFCLKDDRWLGNSNSLKYALKIEHFGFPVFSKVEHER